MADWTKVELLIVRHVKQGSVTTYGDLAEAIYGDRSLGQPVGEMVKKMARERKGKKDETHRVVQDDGTVADIGMHREKLEREGVKVDDTGRVDLERHRAKLPPFSPG